MPVFINHKLLNLLGQVQTKLLKTILELHFNQSIDRKKHLKIVVWLYSNPIVN